MKSERQGCAAALLKAGTPQASASRSAGHDRQRTLLRTSASRKACERLGLEQIGTELYIFRKKCKRGAGAISRSNLVLRWLGNTIFVTPQYCVTSADLKEFYTVHRRSSR